MTRTRMSPGRYRRLRVAAAVAIVSVAGLLPVAAGPAPEAQVPGVCPPFFLRDEAGSIIDPVHGSNARAPYSPKQTCGECHDYDKITEGFHFQQGRGEAPTPEMARRYQWVTSPGNYGGHW